MSGQRISGKDFDISVGDYQVRVANANLVITDNRAVAQDGGVPNGWVDGDVSAEGDMELDTHNFSILVDAAKSAGSWKQLDPFDIVFVADTSGNPFTVDAAECLLKIADLLNIDPAGGETSKHKLQFMVTGRDFIKINGVPYLSLKEIENLA